MQKNLLLSTVNSSYLAHLLSLSRENVGLMEVPGRVVKLCRQGWSTYFSPALLLRIQTYIPFAAFG